MTMASRTRRRVVLTGFDTSKTSQLRFSHPTLGIDNWVYLTSGLTGGRVTAPDHPERPPVTLGTNDSRFNPLTLAFEVTGGQGQYGLTFDDYGRRFTCSNRRPVMHVVLEAGDLKRNPHLAFSQTVEDVSAAGAQAAVWPISGDTTTASFIPSLMSAPHAGTFTAASGVHIHRGDALPDGHRGSVFVCESAQNLVQRQVLSAERRDVHVAAGANEGATSWRRATPGSGPSSPPTAPTARSTSSTCIAGSSTIRSTCRSRAARCSISKPGRERGRIYRIVARDWKQRSAADRPRPDDGGGTGPDARASECVVARNRAAAARRAPRPKRPSRISAASRRPAAATWRASMRCGRSTASPRSRPADIVRGLQDPHAGVRENAVRLAGMRIGTSEDLLLRVLRLADDDDDRVRLRVALALGETTDPRAIDALADLARRDGAQPWMRAAILSSVAIAPDDFLRAFLASPASSPVAKAAVMQDAGQLFGAAESPERCLDLIRADCRSGGGIRLAARGAVWESRRACAPGDRRREPFGVHDAADGDSPQAREPERVWRPSSSRSSTLALDSKAPADRAAGRDRTARTDRRCDGGEDAGTPARPTASRRGAGRRRESPVQLPDRAAASRLVDRDAGIAFTPQVREAVLVRAGDRRAPRAGAARRRREGIDCHHGAGTVAAQPAEEPPRRRRSETRRRALRRSRVRRSDARVRAVARDGAGKGRECHERQTGLRDPLRDVPRRSMVRAGRLGPDLSGIRNQPADAILLHVVVPDYEISPGYQAYVVETRDGKTLVGRLESEAPNSLTLQDASLQSHVILRSQVVSMAASPASLMPAELERDDVRAGAGRSDCIPETDRQIAPERRAASRFD